MIAYNPQRYSLTNMEQEARAHGRRQVYRFLVFLALLSIIGVLAVSLCEARHELRALKGEMAR